MKKWRSGSFVFMLFAVIFISTVSAHAALELRGTDTLGNRLIYDSDLDITWYDYTNLPYDTWQNQINWASTLTVTFGGTIFDDWRLPTTVDGPSVYGYNGDTTVGFNITSSEMGHLFYMELGNEGRYDTAGNSTDCESSGSPWCLTNKGDFQNLTTYLYWSGTELAATPTNAWNFHVPNGWQGYATKVAGGAAIAVRDGDVSISGNPVAPEPISSILFVTGGMLLAGRNLLRGKA